MPVPITGRSQGPVPRRKAGSAFPTRALCPISSIFYLIKQIPTRSIKAREGVGFCRGAQRDEVHVFDLLHVVSGHSIALPATEVCKQQSIRNLIFSHRCGRRSHTNFLFKKSTNNKNNNLNNSLVLNTILNYNNNLL